GPDGNLWFPEFDGAGAIASKIGRITPAGVVTEFPIPPSFNQSSDSGVNFVHNIAAGPDGNLWYVTEENVGLEDLPVFRGKIGRITPAGKVTEFLLRRAGIRRREDDFDQFPDYFRADAIAAGPDGNLWFTEHSDEITRIGRITPAGRITEYTLPNDAASFPNALALAIAAGPDGNLWFSLADHNFDIGPFPEARIGRITPAGIITIFPLPLLEPFGGIDSLTAGPDGNLWLTDSRQSRVVKLTPPDAPTGSVRSASDRGPDQLDGITNVRRPTFTGVSRPG
ncbi:MAG TPA: hypothetical protein VF590_00670, partial [Isosphaeraceae bacterium]